MRCHHVHMEWQNSKKDWHYKLLVRIWSGRTSHSLLVKMQNGQPHWMTVWQFLTKVYIALPYNLAIMRLRINPTDLKTYAERKVCIDMFIAALFIIPRRREAIKMSFKSNCGTYIQWDIIKQYKRAIKPLKDMV